MAQTVGQGCRLAEGVLELFVVDAGTVVDKGVVHPTEYDFYLNAHASIQGTSRPVHYHVLLDQNSLGPDQLQAFTYE